MMGRYFAVLMVFLSVSCTGSRQLAVVSREGTDVDVSIPPFEETPVHVAAGEDAPAEKQDGPAIMNAVRDTETGEMVAVDVINASRVVARFRNVAERAGRVTIEFDVTVPSGLVASRWQLRIFPEVAIGEDSLQLDPILVTGSRYRALQMRGYERYREFVSSIIRDSSVFVMLRPLEIFIERNYPRIYAMKNDTSFVSDPDASDLFGVTQREVLRHYTRYGLARRNRRREERSDEMLERLTGGLEGWIRLDTVITSGAEVCYRYSQTLESRPGLKKIPVTLSGGIYEDGRLLYSLPGKSRVDFYVSSLSSLADLSPHYRSVVVERDVYDYTNAVLDFDRGSAVLDTLAGTNAPELARIRGSMEAMLGMSGYEADSVVVTASCSLEGSYRYNSSLASRRAETVMSLLSESSCKGAGSILKTASVPENWKLFIAMVSADPHVSDESRGRILSLPYAQDPDIAEAELRSLPEYRYFREKVYPRLRTVRLDFYLHRKDMARDTVYTSELDSAYMAGVEALVALDYPAAVEKLGGYRDYNSALAYLSSGYDTKALEVLDELGDLQPCGLYLKAVALSRLGREDEASEIFDKCIEMDPSMLHRGRLDPEIQMFTLKYE